MATDKVEHITEVAGAPKPIAPYTPAIRIGDRVYCSGVLPIDEAGNLVSGGIDAQTEHVLLNMAKVLAAARATMEQVFRLNIAVTDMQDFAAVNAVYAKHFRGKFPTRAVIESSHLPKGALVEMFNIEAYSPESTVSARPMGGTSGDAAADEEVLG